MTRAAWVEIARLGVDRVLDRPNVRTTFLASAIISALVVTGLRFVLREVLRLGGEL